MASNTPPLPTPNINVIQSHRQLAGALGPGVAIASGTAISEVVCVAGSRYLTVRAKTATAGATLSVAFVRPIATTDAYKITSGTVGLGQIDPAKVTQYTTGNPASVALTLGTEGILTATCNGEWYAVVTVTGGGTGTLSYCDVSQL